LEVAVTTVLRYRPWSHPHHRHLQRHFPNIFSKHQRIQHINSY